MRDKPAAFLNGLKQAADATVGQSGRPSQVDTSTIPEVAEAKRRAEEAEALRESGEREIAALRKQISERARAIEEAEQAAKDAKTAAEKVKIIAATVDPVTLDVATDAANELLAAIDFGNLRSAEGLSANDVSVRMWTIIDRVRCRLSTSEVDDDARSTVLVTESLIDACDKYEADWLASNGADAESMPLSLRDPLNSNIAKALAAELRHVLAGTTPSPTMERVGDLIAQNVTPKQIAMMVGLVRPNGAVDLPAFGYMMNQVLAKSGYYDGAGLWLHLRRVGAIDADEGWAKRQRDVGKWRSMNPGDPGTPDTSANGRVGRAIPA